MVGQKVQEVLPGNLQVWHSFCIIIDVSERDASYLLFNPLNINQLGLDVYFHHVAREYEGDPTDKKQFNQFCEQVDNDAINRFKETVEKLLKPLREAWEEAKTNDYWKGIYNERYFTFVEKFRPLVTSNNHYEWKIRPYTDKILELPELEEKLQKQADAYWEPYDAYFRKVNFLFKYFEDRGKMVDEYYAFVEQEDVEDIIYKCERILKDNSLAHALLPTQNGFFFGSTDYDGWYFSDVKDCLKQMKQFLKLFKKPGTGYVIFSW